MHYKLKQLPEDFVVTEIPEEHETGRNTLLHGEYFLCRLVKKNLTTEESISRLSKLLNLPRKLFSYAGTKDKKAVTTQHITVKKSSALKEIELETKTSFLKFYPLFHTNKPLSLGDLKGNSFKIVVRNLPSSFSLPDLPENFYFPNYFGEQRFSEKNFEAGVLLLQKKFKEALSIINNPVSQVYLEKRPNDFIGALKKIPKKILSFYTASVQSHFFNLLLSELIEKNLSPVSKITLNKTKLNIPSFKGLEKFHSMKLVMPGFGQPEHEMPPFLEEKLKTILSEYKLNFIIKQLPSISPETRERNAFALCTNFKSSELEDDELNKGMKKTTLSFTLPKSSYATVLIKFIMGINNHK